MVTIIKLAEKLKVDVPEFVKEYSTKFDDITEDNIDDIGSVIEYQYYEDDITEYVDALVPLYYSEIDKVYDQCGVSIDDVINDGLVEPMESESDIYCAKQVAIFVSLEQDTYSELKEFKDAMESGVMECENDLF